MREGDLQSVPSAEESGGGGGKARGGSAVALRLLLQRGDAVLQQLCLSLHHTNVQGHVRTSCQSVDLATHNHTGSHEQQRQRRQNHSNHFLTTEQSKVPLKSIQLLSPMFMLVCTLGKHKKVWTGRR